MKLSRVRVAILFAGFISASVAAYAAEPPPPAPKEASSPAPAAVVAPAPTVPNNQIWECTTNGVRTFSSNPCGVKSSLRELNPINVMQPPPPAYRPARNYTPASSPPAANYGNAAPEGSEENYVESAYPAYPAYIAVPRPHRVHPHSNGARERPRPSAPHPR
jgi:hypothetical protein